jgi:hypothetical protein
MLAAFWQRLQSSLAYVEELLSLLSKWDTEYASPRWRA